MTIITIINDKLMLFASIVEVAVIQCIHSVAPLGFTATAAGGDVVAAAGDVLAAVIDTVNYCFQCLVKVAVTGFVRLLGCAAAAAVKLVAAAEDIFAAFVTAVVNTNG